MASTEGKTMSGTENDHGGPPIMDGRFAERRHAFGWSRAGPAQRAAVDRSALQLQDRLMPLHDAMFCETNPGPVKYAASRLGLCTEDMRLPMVPLTDGARKIVDDAMAKAGLLTAVAAE